MSGRKNSVRTWLALMMTGMSFAACAAGGDGLPGGVSLGATRVIYPAGSKQVSLSVNNSSAGTFLIQSWVEGSDGQKNAFAVTPPLFVMAPKKENTLRLVYGGDAGDALPADRETVFYLNVKAIPRTEKRRDTAGGELQIAIQSRIKVFYRPAGLAMSSDVAHRQVRCTVAGGALTLRNASPYYVSTINLTVGGAKLPNTMVPPKGQVTVPLSGAGTGSVAFQTVNDYGVYTPSQQCGE